jgi:membrane fusion protein (multidrug efflux system)
MGVERLTPGTPDGGSSGVPTLGPVEAPERRRGHRRELFVLVVATLVLAVVGAFLVNRADRKVNRVALGAAPRPVTVQLARATPYRDSRAYVGSIDPWVEANIGPQYISAYIETVTVRPGDAVKRGQVLATLDCSNPSAVSRAAAMQVRAVGARQLATADQAARERSMLDGGFIAPNQVEQTTALSVAEQAQVLESQAKQVGMSLDVRDCVLRAPFDGEIATRTMDPGAFVRPGTPIVSIVDRNTVRVTVDAPEKDFDLVPVATPVRVRTLATGAEVEATVSRRSPLADAKTRTVHFEVDVPDPRHEVPAGTTAVVLLDVGQPVPATEIPLYATTQQEGKARFFLVEGGVAHLHQAPVLGERGGSAFFAPNALAANAQVVTEGRALLTDGDPVQARTEPPPAAPLQTDGGTRGGGYGRPL